MSVLRATLRPGSYYDSVVLMRLQRALTGLAGVSDAGVVMATPANLEILAESGLLPPEVEPAPTDLLISVKAETEEQAAAALSQIDALLALRTASGQGGYRPKSLAAAVRLLPSASWVLISVPGRHAAELAGEALDLGRNVFLYSDNVALADEVALKRKAGELGLLVMGPDCGTAIVGGVGLGFANRVRRGGVGLVAASGTGLQAVACRIHELGGGVSQAIGTGGRDLSAEVGGATARQALDLLARDPATEVIVLISKPPAPCVAAGLLAAAQATGKPVVVHFLGFAPPARCLGRLRFAVNLAEAAELAMTAERGRQEDSSLIVRGQVCGLFSGGTLAYEAELGLKAFLDPGRFAVLDLGADEYTVGRLHPMIDQELRLRRLRQEAADPRVGVLLLDVVLGDGAHADPAGELAPVVEQVIRQRDGSLQVVAVVVGTKDDPQNLSEQIATLSRAGAEVCSTVPEALDLIFRGMARPPSSTGVPARVQAPLAAINVGLESFYDSLVAQTAPAIHVEWRPPAGGNERLAAILARMKQR
jgi:FdrA protein